MAEYLRMEFINCDDPHYNTGVINMNVVVVVPNFAGGGGGGEASFCAALQMNRLYI